MEAFYSETKPRQFNIRLNGVLVLPEINILHKVDTCQGLDLVAEFQVQNGLLQPAGLHQSRIPNDGIVFLDICYGDGMASKNYDPSYVAASFYIVQLPCFLGPPPTTTMEPTTEMFLTTITPPRPHVKDYDCAKLKGAVQCKTTGDGDCEFNLYNETCIGPVPKWCPDHFRLYSGCTRGNVWYFVSGIPCRSQYNDDKGVCHVIRTTTAVNFNGPKHVDSRSIYHRAEMTSLFEDPHGTRLGIHIETHERSQCPDGVRDIHPQDETLFSSLILASNEGRKSGRCVGYRTNVTRDGVYELNIKTVETFWSDSIGNGAKPRYLNIFLNGQRIYAEYNILQRNPACSGVDMYTEFQVKDGWLTAAGLLSSAMPEDTEENPVLLEFCYGDGGNRSQYDPNYLVSSFSIVELHPGQDPMTAPPTLGPTTSELTTITPDPTMTPEECPFYTNLIECKMAGCEFNMTSGTCFEIKECSNDTSLTACRRGNAYYTVGGVACISKIGDGDCELEDVVIAVNLFGPEHIDSKQITHLADMNTFWSDEGNTRQDIHVETWDNSQCMEGVTGIPAEDSVLYSSLIVGRNEARDPSQCIMYHTNITKNGRYEFSVRTVETFWADQIGNGAKPRQFNIRLNGMTIWPEFNILHRAKACQGIELIAEFDVTDKMLTPAGLPSTTLKVNGAFEVEFCYGDGDPSSHYDPNYIIASVYIVRLKPSEMPPPPPPPTLPPRPPTTRRSTTAITRRTTTKRKTTTPKSILSTTLKPVPPGPQPTIPAGKCSNRNENFTFCTCIDPHNRCDSIFVPDGTGGKFQCVQRYIFCDKLNLDFLELMFPGDTCKRARGTYSYGGYICNNELQDYNNDVYTKQDEGVCTILKTVIAVRFNGNTTHRDVRGIEYQPFSKFLPDNYDYKIKPVRLRHREDGNTLCDERPIPKKIYKLAEADYQLWEYYATGVNTSTGDCFSYVLNNLTEDGTYELMIKTTDYEYEEKDDRAFNIKLAGHYVFRELDPHKIWKALCVATELITIFEVTDNLKTITPRGFPATSIPMEGIEVAFCRGECRNWARKNFEFIGMAFSVHKIQTFYSA